MKRSAKRSIGYSGCVSTHSLHYFLISLNLFLLLGCTVPMIFCAGKKKGGIWLEILLFVALVLVLPLISSVLSTGLSVVAGNYRGSSYMAAYSIVNTISGWFTWTAGIGRAITLVACGMSITYKKLSK